ncbi:beta-ketoacyl synthase N-terminal-like domain-containing protein [Streptomyces sp. NPDC100445]|uniref:beta-ketoacyl synthase N-terminal-like domain-containing protein n=1 Tax=Streptomyces sp. NPDC100445 TaxID=3366102 RepID=UPI003820E4D2
MTTPQAATVIVGGTAPRMLDGLRSRRDLSVRAAGETLGAAFVDVLSTALGHLPAALRTAVPVVLAATDYCVTATTRYVSRCVEAEAGGRRLRPSEAMTPEPAQLLQELAAAGGWDGPGYVLISPRAATLQAVRWAWGTIGAGLHEAMVVCELVRDPHGDGYRIAAAPVTAAARPVTAVGARPAPDGGGARPAPADGAARPASDGEARPVLAGGEAGPVPDGGARPAPAGGEAGPVPAGGARPAPAGGEAGPVPDGGARPAPAGGEAGPASDGGARPAPAGGEAGPVPDGGARPVPDSGGARRASAVGEARPVPAVGEARPVPAVGEARPVPAVGEARPAPADGPDGPGRTATRRPRRSAGSSVVLSGTGLVTAFGDGGTVFWESLLAGGRGLGELTRFDASRFRGTTVCQTDVEAGTGQPTRRALVDRARSEALREAGLTELPDRALLVYAGVVPHLPRVDDAPRIDEIALEPDWDGDGSGVAPRNAVLMAHACASGAFGLAMAREWLLCGLADTAVVTGVSALNAYDYACLDTLRATSTTAARPFDEDRSGVTVGEGAGVIVLETAEHAAARGHVPLATLSGISCRVAGQGISRLNAHIGAACMREALAMAGLTTVDYVHGHAPGTRQGDEAELLALDRIGAEHGWRDVPVSSYKGAAGHLLHASVFPGVVAAVRALRHEVLPGTPGLREPMDARHVRVLRDPEPCAGIRSVMVDNFGFGGNNAAFLLTRGAAGRMEWSRDG